MLITKMCMRSALINLQESESFTESELRQPLISLCEGLQFPYFHGAHATIFIFARDWGAWMCTSSHVLFSHALGLLVLMGTTDWY